MNYENYKFGKYIDTNQETRWATLEEIKSVSSYINLMDEDYKAAGIPIISNGKEAWVDSQDTHTIIFGATGSKKTRLFCMPTINIFAKAGESFVVTDPKGELYAKTSGLVKSKGYKTIVLNFRDIGYGDMWNPLIMPYDLYHSGNKELAISMLNDFVSTIAEPQFKSSPDIFWPQMASSYALACLLLLMESAQRKEVNVGSLGRLCNSASEASLSKLCDKMSEETIAGMNFKGVLSSHEGTRKSIFASLYGMVRIFNTQKNVTKMLSGNTIDLRNIGREKTAVYIIVPDEKTTLHFLVTTFIKQTYEILISEAQKEKNFKLPVRVNFLLDEFCNIPTIPDMPNMISAARSRNMRYYLIVQSMHQLTRKYGDDAETIKGNCDNWVFLTSKELSLLREISDLCGEIHMSGDYRRKLISVSELQRFDKQKGEVLIMHARQYPIITEMADIELYKMFRGYETVPIKKSELSEFGYFSPHQLVRDVENGLRECPFVRPDDDDCSTDILGQDDDDELVFLEEDELDDGEIEYEEYVFEDEALDFSSFQLEVEMDFGKVSDSDITVNLPEVYDSDSN